VKFEGKFDESFIARVFLFLSQSIITKNGFIAPQGQLQKNDSHQKDGRDDLDVWG
jgi:hypothetical protein